MTEETRIKIELQAGLESILNDKDLEFLECVTPETKNVYKGLLSTVRHAEVMNQKLEDNTAADIGIVTAGLMILAGDMKFEAIEAIAFLTESLLKEYGLDGKIIKREG